MDSNRSYVTGDHRLSTNERDKKALVATLYEPPADDGRVDYSQRNRWKATITINDDCFLKDYSGLGRLARFIGAIQVRTERKALTVLQDIRGIPHLVSQQEPYSIRLSKMHGTPLKKLTEITREFFWNLKKTVHHMHERGVAHGDLHRRNILADGDDVAIVDFATARIDQRPRKGILFRWWCQLDEHWLYKIEQYYFGTGVEPKMFWLYRLVKIRKH